MIRIDTNYILRYLLNDNPEMANIAEKVILHDDIYLSNEVMAEVIYVLSGVYELKRQDISSTLLTLTKANNIQNIDKYSLLKALEMYGEKSLDFVDCLLCVHAKVDRVLTFDKKLNKCIKGQNIS
ncbi:MAG: PIN domain-containing protein [Sulfurovum sp.]|nr:PIN domain-containing protein [Sulfurovum sp.]